MPLHAIGYLYGLIRFCECAVNVLHICILGPRRRDDSKLGFIIGCIAAAVGTAIVVSIVTILYMRRKRCKQAASNVSQTLLSSV